MKQLEMWKYCLAAALVLVCLLFFIPWLTVDGPQPEDPEPDLPPEQEREPVLPPASVGTDDSYTVRVLLDGTVTEMTMGEYLQGVVRAEMPALFEQEALCAQAVAARTYTLHKMMQAGDHPEADVCTDPFCCQAYMDEETARAGWGADWQENSAKIRTAVSATDGQTAVYGGVPILAVFHSSSTGQTRRAGEVWSSDLPYLQSVSSPENGDSVPNYYSRVEVSTEDFRRTFLEAHPEARFPAKPEKWITGVTMAEESGQVDTVTVGGVTVRGVELRQLFGLRSAAFQVEVQKENVVFFVTGYGHGVGMSQYGANEMAKDGATWEEIIRHYYTGVSLETRSG